MLTNINEDNNLCRMERGELYDELTPQLVAARKRCAKDEEDAILHEYPWIERPIKIDHGTNITAGSNSFINNFHMDTTVVENSGYGVYNEICQRQLCTF
ncbi:hypothetical protein BDV32DRAFT_147383 [Aspergillus pseudonomiae]|nr:hypothetical protein BDV32DRAFT_147383 [Aspergillus pseudonomiae]